MEESGAHLALIACRFVHDAGAMFLWGAFGFLALVPRALAADVGARLATARKVAIVLVAAAVVASLPLEAAMIGDGWGSALDPAILRPVLFQTTFGIAWLLDAVAAILLLVALCLREPLARQAVVAPAALALLSLAFTGHAMVREGAPGAVQRLNDCVHVLAAGAWVGALVPLILVLRPFGTDGRTLERMLALHRFSGIGRWAVVLVLATGVANTLLIVGHLPFDTGSRYQMLLLAKIAVVAAMVVLASINQFISAPRLAGEPERAAAAIRRGAVGEVVLALAAIGLVAVFGMLDPM